MDDALYVYGIVKTRTFMKWEDVGIENKKVYIIIEGNFSALAHKCKEKPYISDNPNKIKQLIILHNNILDRAMEEFGGVIPFHFNTIIKSGKESSKYNLRKWLNDEEEKLEKIWNKVNQKKEYGIRIYYDKDKLMQESYNTEEIREIEESLQARSEGLKYLLQSKIKSEINESIWKKVNQFKQKLYNYIEGITNNVIFNNPRIFIKEEKDLLLSLSILVDEQQFDEIKKILEGNKDFSFQLTGPFAPYSFIEN